MLQPIKDYFTFSKRERNGIIFLTGIVIMLLIMLNFSSVFYPKTTTDFSQFENEIAEFQAATDTVQEFSQNEFSEKEEREITSDAFSDSSERFEFNPNQLPSDDWKRLGLSEKQINIIKNYEAKGGKFNKKEDLQKIYGVTEQLYKSLENYIAIPERQLAAVSYHQSAVGSRQLADGNRQPAVGSRQKPVINIEINSADSAAWEKLRGIGPSYARRIVKYRESLGGFQSIEQLKEVWGMNDTLYELIFPHLIVDLLNTKKININNCNADTLRKHPYIRKWNIANAIVNYRSKHGAYKEVAEIKNTDLVNDSLFVKIAPYLVTE